MRPVLLWTPEAREDLIALYVSTSLENPSAAEILYTAIEHQATLLIDHPRMGVRRPEIAPSARMLVEGVYLILYETHPDTNEGRIDEVEIVRVVHGHRDRNQLFPP